MNCGGGSQNNATTEEAAEAIMEEAAPEEAVADSEQASNYLPYSQIVHQVDTVAGQHVIKELKSHQTFDPTESVNFCTVFSFDFMDGDGSGDPCTDYDLPEEYYALTNKYQNLRDTTFMHDYIKVSIDSEGNLVYMRLGLVIVIIDYSKDRNIKNAAIGYQDERSEQYSWILIERDYKNNLRFPNGYLFVNGENVINKDKLNIVDYYALMVKSGNFSPDHTGGNFDIKNGYFEISDDGTGAGLYTNQLVLFRKNNGEDVLALSNMSIEPVSYPVVTSGSPPTFFTFNREYFTKTLSIFPELDNKIFFSNEYAGETGIETYYTLPQKGLSIKYSVNMEAVNFCNQMDESNVNYDAFKDRCGIYAALESYEVELPFDKETGTFSIKN
jgi:hypothetical protein